MSYSINIETITFDAFCKLDKLDRSFVGTPDYMGLAYFWGCNGVKHYLRDATIYQRKQVHKKWLERGLPLNGESEEHYKIIKQVMRLNENQI